MVRSTPVLLAVNQTSEPSAFQTSPWTVYQTSVRVVFLPFVSTTAMEPLSSPWMG